MKRVKISGVRKAFRKSDNQPFFVFDLTGEATAITSSTGKLSIVVPKASSPVSMTVNDTNAAILASMVGTSMDGSIARVETAPREFTGADGKTYTSRHQWVFVAPGATVQSATAVASEIAESPVAQEDI
jgi:hypothetical protein